MKVKHFVLLCAVALIVSLASLLINKQQAGESQFEHQSFITNIDLSELDSLVISSGQNELVLARRGKNWVLPSHYEYSVDHEKLKNLVQKLQNAKIVELKTRDPKKFARLKLNDLTASDGQGMLVELRQKDKTFSFLLGAASKGTGGQYARLIGNMQSYLIDQDLDLSAFHKDWINTSVLSLTSNEIEQLAWSKDEEGFVVKRVTLDEEFKLVEPSVVAPPKYPSIFTGLVRNLVNIEAEDVKPITDSELKELLLSFSIEITASKNSEPQQLYFYKNHAEEYWLQIEGQGWLYQLSPFSYKQLGKPLAEYLNQEN